MLILVAGLLAVLWICFQNGASATPPRRRKATKKEAVEHATEKGIKLLFLASQIAALLEPSAPSSSAKATCSPESAFPPPPRHLRHGRHRLAQDRSSRISSSSGGGASSLVYRPQRGFGAAEIGGAVSALPWSCWMAFSSRVAASVLAAGVARQRAC